MSFYRISNIISLAVIALSVLTTAYTVHSHEAQKRDAGSPAKRTDIVTYVDHVNIDQ